MKKSVQLKQQRAQKIDAQKAILDAAKAENRSAADLNPTESDAFDLAQREIDELSTKITRVEQAEANELLIASLNVAPVTTDVNDGEGNEKAKVYGRASILKALRDANPANGGKLEGAEKELHEIGAQENRAANVETPKNSIAIPLSYLNRATQQTVTQDGGTYGGALVQNQAPRMVEPLRPRLAFEDLGATFLTGLSGGNIPMVVGNDFAMAFLAEGAAITPAKKEYAGPTLAPKRAGGAVDISNQLIMQSSVDVESQVIGGLRNGFAQLLHGACINGAGGVAPTGLLSYTGVNAAADVAAAAATWAKIVELQALIEEDNATDISLGWLMHPKLKAALKQIKKDAGSGRFLLEADVLDGLRFISTSLVPVLDAAGTDVYPLIYGDFSQMTIGQWGSLNVTINPYSADLSDSVRLVLNTHADMQIANPKAFAKNAFLTDAV